MWNYSTISVVTRFGSDGLFLTADRFGLEFTGVGSRLAACPLKTRSFRNVALDSGLNISTGDFKRCAGRVCGRHKSAQSAQLGLFQVSSMSASCAQLLSFSPMIGLLPHGGSRTVAVHIAHHRRNGAYTGNIRDL